MVKAHDNCHGLQVFFFFFFKKFFYFFKSIFCNLGDIALIESLEDIANCLIVRGSICVLFPIIYQTCGLYLKFGLMLWMSRVSLLVDL
jgi:hypothetical protein